MWASFLPTAAQNPLIPSRDWTALEKPWVRSQPVRAAQPKNVSAEAAETSHTLDSYTTDQSESPKLKGYIIFDIQLF